MDMEIIIVNEENQIERDKYHMISLICGIKKNTNELITKQKQTHRVRNRIYSYWGGGE